MRLTFNLISGLRDKITQANLCFGSVALVAPMSHTIKFVVSTPGGCHKRLPIWNGGMCRCRGWCGTSHFFHPCVRIQKGSYHQRVLLRRGGIGILIILKPISISFRQASAHIHGWKTCLQCFRETLHTRMVFAHYRYAMNGILVLVLGISVVNGDGGGGCRRCITRICISDNHRRAVSR
jgi:hypothetical protein